MSIKTIDEAYELMEQFEELQRRAVPVAEQLFEIENDRCVSIDQEEITVESGGLYANFTEYGRCGHYEEHSLHIPLEHLFDTEWMDKAMAKVEARRGAEREEKRLREEKAEQKAIEDRLKQYRKLKLEFEGTDQ